MPQASDPIAAGVIDVIKNVSRRPVEPALASALVADLGFDSLQLLELVAELEDRFDITIPATAMPAVTTVADIVDALARLLDGGAAGR
jgi:acyl carrier protein